MTDGRTPLRTLIVDDEPLAVERLQILCANVPALHLVGTASDGAAALRLVDALKPELLLLDIAMPGLTGLEVADALQGRASRPAVVFVTAFDQFAVAAFDVAAIDYLLKPVALDRLEKAVARIATNLTTEAATGPPPVSPWVQEFWVPHRDSIVRVPANDIDLIEAERDYMRLHVGARSFLLHQTISELERRLDPESFVRLHRSTIVRRGHIAAFHYDDSGAWMAQLNDGRRLRVGRTHLANARAIVGRG